MKTMSIMNIKRLTFIVILLVGISQWSYSQLYTPVTFNYKNKLVYGVKIKTNLPFTNGSQMPTLLFEGYNYGKKRPLGLILTWYIYGDNFYNPKVSSFGADIPSIKLSNEGGKVVIFMDVKDYYYYRFSVRAFAEGLKETGTWFDGWQAIDEPLSGTNTVTVPYENSFTGNVNMPEGIWKSNGNVGIGTVAPSNTLDVNGTIRAKEVKIETTNWPDYVFAPDYDLPTLQEVARHIGEKQHLPGIPSEAEVRENGMDLGGMQAKLLQKIEELTLYLIDQDKTIRELQQEIRQLKEKP